MATAGTRVGRRQPLPPPVPSILHLPRRSRLSRPAAKHRRGRSPARPGRNLGALIEMERFLVDGGARERRGRVEAAASISCESGCGGGGDSGEEKWRFQAEILRAECNFLRMEREVALRKLERNRARAEAAVKSAMETLESVGTKKTDGDSGAAAALEEEIRELEAKLEELRLGRREGTVSFKELQRSCGRNFDRQASALRRRLEKMADETRVKEIREVEAAEEKDEAAPVGSDPNHGFPDVEMLQRKMEGLSKGMLARMEEHGWLLTADSSSNSGNKGSAHHRGDNGQRRAGHVAEKVVRNHCHRLQQKRQRQKPQEQVVEEVEKNRAAAMEVGSCCNCKEVVARIMEQVRAETEQWSELQGMLEQVRVEMEDLRSSRDRWQRRAIASDIDTRSVHNQMLEWKQRARASECEVTELQKLVSGLQIKLLSIRPELSHAPSSSSQPHLDIRVLNSQRIKSKQQRPVHLLKEKEKHVLVCRLKNSQSNVPRRSPLQDIGNTTSPLLRP